MPILQVGATEIPYRIRRSQAAKRKRIVVTPGQVEVVVPISHDENEVADFMHGKRRWVFDRCEEMSERTLEHPFPTHFATGGKVLYRGRRLRLTVAPAAVSEVQVTYRNGLRVATPTGLDDAERDRQVEVALTGWMKARVQSDAVTFMRRHAPRLGVEPRGLRVKNQRRLWGSCGENGVIHLNWHLVFAPKSLLEYVVVHELCHLRHRNHSPSFWALVATVIPNYVSLQSWLDRHGGWGLLYCLS